MNRFFLATLLLALLLTGCGLIFTDRARPAPEEAPPPPPPAEPAVQAPPSLPPVGQLVVTPSQSPALVEWGGSAEIVLQVAWVDDRRQAVQIVPAEGTPPWIAIELQPAVVEPPATTTLRVTTTPGAAVPGPLQIALDLSSFGFEQPEREELAVTILRQAGEFHPLLAGPVTIECRNVCGQVENGRVTFYDVLKEQGQSCTEGVILPDAQRIGGRSFQLASSGFGYGRTCRIAAVFESSGTLSFVNLGLTPALPRGAVLLSVRGALDAWLSPDNTVALVRLANALIPYDVTNGRQLGGICRIDGEFQPVTLRSDSLFAGACAWQIR